MKPLFVDESAKSLIESRYRLVESASLAKRYGCSADEWMNDESVLSFCDENGLDRSILEHVYHWVWLQIER